MATEHTETVETTEHTENTETTERTPTIRKVASTTTPARPADRPLPEDPDELREELRRTREQLSRVNNESKDRRLRLEELEAEDERRKQANLSEAEKIKRAAAAAEAKATEAERRAADAEAALIEERINSAVEREAAKLNFDYPDIAPRLIDRDRVTINEETRKPEGIKEALERLLKEKPGLATATPRGGSPPREGPRRVGGVNGNRRQSTPEEEIEADLRATGNYV